MNDGNEYPTIGGRRYEPTLRLIHEKLQPCWYLEIGSQTGKSLAQVDCNYIAVDPEFKVRFPIHKKQEHMFLFQLTSDEFFKSEFLAKNQIMLDIAFLDGMHLFEFLLRDFINTEKHCNKDGMVILHDCCPTSFTMTERNRELCRTRAWTGDVWKTLYILTKYRPDLTIDVINARPTGLVCITGLQPASNILLENYATLVQEFSEVSLEDFGVAKFYDSFELQPVRKFIHNISVKKNKRSINSPPARGSLRNPSAAESRRR